MEPTLRKPFGVLGILLFITGYAALIAHFADAIFRLPFVVQILLFLVLGIAWVFPLKPLLRWMETGKFR
ncbi:MAG TPA: DUF2842 domain-containing protein [Chakrabartia sp.]|jgi:hypothetical protein|nr:DUF2842 domain-containing protein [Chakrabartia sp.]